MKPCPFDAPPLRQLRPMFLEASHEVDAKTIEWFISEHDLEIPVGSPLARWLRTLRRSGVDGRIEPAGVMEQIEKSPAADINADPVTRAAIADLYGAHTLAWCIRVLKAKRNADLITIDSSVVRHELLGLHHSEARLPMPGATGTLYQAARLHQAGEGKMRICGKGSVGVDIVWEPASGGQVVIERKDRAFEAAALDDDRKWLRFVEKNLLSAAPKLFEHRPAVRVISFGLVGNSTRTKQLQGVWKQCVLSLLESVSPEHVPDAIYGAFNGYGVVNDQLDVADHGHFIEVQRADGARPADWDTIARVFHMAYDPKFRRNGYALDDLEDK